MSRSRVEVLVSEGCPNAKLVLEHVRDAIAAARASGVETLVVRVESHADAAALHFLGSPSVRVDGLDVDASADGRDDFGLQCRLYAVDGRFEHAPPVEWIASALARRSSP